MASLLSRDALFGTRVAGQAANVVAFLRVAAAVVFIVFGVAKFTHHEDEVASFENYGVPSPDAFTYLIGTLEVVGGVLLLIGLLTRLAALALAGNMVGAIVLSGIKEGETFPSLTLAPVLLAIMLLLVWAGPGPRALDERLVR
jgi:putative oxidoreductase